MAEVNATEILEKLPKNIRGVVSESTRADGERVALVETSGSWTYRDLDAAITETQTWLAVIEPGDAPIGYVMLTTPDLPLKDITAEDIEIKRIYLFARFQGSGAGKLLLNQAVDAAKDAGKRRLLLGVNAENELALAFYYRNGFEKVGVRKFQVGDLLCDDFILAKPL